MFFKPSMLFLDETDDTEDARGRYETYLSVSLVCWCPFECCTEISHQSFQQLAAQCGSAIPHCGIRTLAFGHCARTLALAYGCSGSSAKLNGVTTFGRQYKWPEFTPCLDLYFMFHSHPKTEPETWSHPSRFLCSVLLPVTLSPSQLRPLSVPVKCQLLSLVASLICCHLPLLCFL